MAEFFNPSNCIWLGLALVWSLVYGICATKGAWTPDPSPTIPFFYHYWWPVYSFVFETLGALVGWVMLYFLWRPPFVFDTVHFVALAIAFLGLTGHLPGIVRRLPVKIPGT